MSQVVEQCKSGPAEQLGVCVVTISDTRTLETDRGGALVVELVEQSDHQVIRRKIIQDEPQAITEILSICERDEKIQAVLMTGGTGISPRDQTFETVKGLFTREIPGYGELFRFFKLCRNRFSHHFIQNHRRLDKSISRSHHARLTGGRTIGDGEDHSSRIKTFGKRSE